MINKIIDTVYLLPVQKSTAIQSKVYSFQNIVAQIQQPQFENPQKKLSLSRDTIERLA
jgi:hypothetical protein